MDKMDKNEATFEELKKRLAEQKKTIDELKTLLEESKFKEDQYNSIIDNLSECVDRELPDYTAFYVNKAYCDFYEVTPKEAYAINGMDWIVPEDRERVHRQIQSATPENPEYHYTCQVITTKGKKIWIEVLGRNFYDAQGNIIESQDVSRDITYYKEAASLADDVRMLMEEKVRIRTLELNNANGMLEETNAFLQSTLNNITEGIISIQKNGINTFVNYGANSAWKEREDSIRKTIQNEIALKDSVLHRLLFEKKEFQNIEMSIDKNIQGLVSGIYLHNHAESYGKALLIIHPIEEVKRLVNRFSGTQAPFEFCHIIGKSPGITEVISFAKKIAQSEGNVVIEGESGTGKELFAQSIHNASTRKKEPFIAVNCGAIPRDLIGSELFGYDDGAFTGAKKGGKPGKFEMASGGTIFLDEIGDMPQEQQISLLRVIQERKVVRIGGHKEIPVNVRIICATNRNLYQEVTIGNFRNDLYYRLNVMNIQIPPLRQRKEDIAFLFKHFLRKITLDNNQPPVTVDEEVIEALENYSWPGNVRELQNAAERSYFLHKNTIIHYADVKDILIDIPFQNMNKNTTINSSPTTILESRQNHKKRKEEEERVSILELLEKNNGNATKAAEEMGISRTAFYRKIKKYTIE